jgi:hypothetical protein
MPESATIGAVSEERVLECKASARFWATHLGPYADEMDRRGDAYAIAASVLSAITGLAVWTTLSKSTEMAAVVVVSLVAFSSAVVGQIPKIKGYSECAKTSRELSSAYGDAYGDLCDAAARLKQGDPNAATEAGKMVEEFQAVRDKKEALKPYPAKLAKLPRTQLSVD